MVHSPRVSVLLPVRNGLPWLGRAVESIVQQTFGDFELIVLEDGSTDDTPAVLRTFQDPRLRIIATGGVGIAHALNTGLGAARGAYVARQDADDESEPTRLARQIAVLDAQPDIDLVATVADYIDADGQIVDNAWVRTVRQQQDPARTPEAIADLMPLTCCITHGSILARTEALRAAGGYRPETVPAEDYDLWLRLLPAHRMVKLEARLYRHRLHAEQSGARARERQTLQTVLAKLRHVRRLYPELPRHARLTIGGGGRGEACYRAVASEAGFEICGASATLDSSSAAGAATPLKVSASPIATTVDWDIVVVTDFAAIDQYGCELQRHGVPVDRVGNFFVKRTRCPVAEALPTAVDA